VDNKQVIDWTSYSPPEPTFLGNKIISDVNIEDLIDYIDWTPFFITWELAGKYPKILKDPVVGEAASNLFADAQAMLKELIQNRSLTTSAVIGFWPANSVNSDDIDVFSDESREEVAFHLHHLRQQSDKPSQQANFCLADYVAPAGMGIKDYIGGFVVTAGLGVEELAAAYEADKDDYNAILVKSLADRLAEAFAEYMHERVRKEFWGYDVDENLENAELIKERYSGIRPAPGYPACPDHTEKATLFKLLDASNATGVELTEHFAMTPASTVSGFYFSHPESRYFGIGKIEKDQVESYAARKNMTIAEAERWLSPVLKYK
jgi:5-methyltetrahydrofolate--homocysteine methyltransferase